MELEEWLCQQRDEGKLQSSGRFTVDVARARVKLARFQLQPGLYLARLLQAGVAAGSRSIDVKFELSVFDGILEGYVAIRYSEPDLEVLSLEQVLPGLEAPRTLSDANNCMATGLLGAQGATEGGEITWETSRGERLSIVNGEVRVYQGPPSRTGTTWSIVRAGNLKGLSAEREVLHERCGYLPIPLWVNGQLIPSGWGCQVFLLAEQYEGGSAGAGLGLPSGSPERSFLQDLQGTPPWRSALAISSALEGFSQIHWVSQGVVMEWDNVDLGCPGALAVVDSAGMKTDLSFKVVMDDEYKRCLQDLLSRVEALLARLQRRREEIRLPKRSRVLKLGFGLLGTFAAAVIPALLPFMAAGLFSLVYSEWKADSRYQDESQAITEKLKRLPSAQPSS